MRLLALSEALTGFGFISLAVTYLVSLTAALERNRAVALSFYHQARQGADVAGLLIHHFVGERFVGLESIFAEAARDLQGLLESHIEHPLIYYFHPTPGAQESTTNALFGAGSLRGHPRLPGRLKPTRNSVGTRSCAPWKKLPATSCPSWPLRWEWAGARP